MLKLNEIFYSMQGEGKSTGLSKLFIRLSGCNNKCSFCDTKYHIKSRSLNAKDIILLKKYKEWVITGGEPLLQQIEILNLIEKFKPNSIDIETNGTIIPCDNLISRINCFNISPKEVRSQPKGYNLKPSILRMIPRLENRIIKFVYSDKISEQFISRYIKEYNLRPWEIWIMPEGATREKLIKNSQKVWNYCIEKDFNFSARLQVWVFNIKRGI
mgnify:CR=1 FL=1